MRRREVGKTKKRRFVVDNGNYGDCFPPVRAIPANNRSFPRRPSAKNGASFGGRGRRQPAPRDAMSAR